MGSSNDSPEQISLLTGGQQQLQGLLEQLGIGRLQSGPFQNQLDVGAFGASDLQNQAFGLASAFGQNPFSQGGQAALDQLLSGEAAFQVTPELTARRNELFNQSLAPAQAAFQQELAGLQDQFGAAGLGRSGGIIDQSLRSAERFGGQLAQQRSGILQGDINAGIRSQELARQLQAQGLGIEQQGRAFGLSALGQFGGLQRQISGQQAGIEFGNRQRQDPFSDPAINTILALLGNRTFGFQQQQQGGGGLGALLGGLGSIGGAFFGGPAGAFAGGQIGSGIGNLFG